MLTETPLAFPALADQDLRPAPYTGILDPRDERPSPEVTADRQRQARIDRALDAVDALQRRRRAQALVEAIERLGAGLDTTMHALDAAVDAVVVHDAPGDARPAPLRAPALPAAWGPISTPVVPITADVGPAAPGTIDPTLVGA